MLIWILFGIFILILLACDLFIFQKKPHSFSFKESLLWSLFWIFLSILFGIVIYFSLGEESSLDFFTGYAIEKSLSIDNVFVFILIFRSFKTPEEYHHKTLFWGVLGAILLRGLFIILGVTLIAHFHQVFYVLGFFLIFSGIKLLFQKEKKIVSQESLWIKFLKKIIPVTSTYHDGQFFIREKNKLIATPLFLTLLAIEITDVIFALDSIPAIFSITLDPFIVFSSNIFAILGLRSLYFVLAHMINYFHYMHYGVALILTIAGLKMIASYYVTVPVVLTLGIIIFILSMSIIASLIFPKKK